MECRGRVLVISADVGAGHDTAAGELTRRLRERGFTVDRLNLLDVLPRPVRWMLREAYRDMLRRLPRGYDALFTLTARSRLSVALIRGLLRPVRRRMGRAVPPDTLAVVTTYPFANQLLGPLRRQGRLTVPVVSYVTDFALHPTWLSPGVDRYYALRHAEVPPVDADATPVTTVRPLVSPAFGGAHRTDRRQARRRFGLPERDRLALIVAGAWGAGDVETTVAEVGATGWARPVVVCGRNTPLYDRLRRDWEHVFGWVDDMPTLMRAVDVVVENAGGLTCQEALSAGVPVVTYRPLPGHGRANAGILARAGLTRRASSAEQLRPALIETSGRRDRPAPLSADPADVEALVTEMAAVPGDRRAYHRPRRHLGDAVAVVAALLASSRGRR
ncbi:MGDG synthase family glycosyltransferase [Micromonospora humidisoli]|uniref:UDP-N-acetylglucosamine--LPS N-acetylglucosamine transferase n=1 Tax=Micromonospora humidisoli TaxID=2807622 RepID=A0ABS2JDX2_9ACTN|nr:glycosyltransferase [Micromonospora humidisoli]MBM7084742.1 UDP-N-acetylglucosamine--LPS N-acetylglucosamine transferase [Micromonospora humidisoli]